MGVHVTDCYFDGDGCLVCPDIPATPAKVTRDANVGWNAGANSIVMLEGDVHVVESLDAVPAGIVIGLKGTREFVTAPSAIEHGFYLYTAVARAYIEIRERGQRVGTARPYTLGTAFEIRRVGGEISYWLAGVLLAQTPARVLGPVLVNACLYAAGDTLP